MRVHVDHSGLTARIKAQAPPRTAAEQDRDAVLDRVAERIWHAPAIKPDQTWERAKALAAAYGDPELTYRVESTRAEARAAVEALIIAFPARQGEGRMAHAGEHVSGLTPVDCAETFNAMLAEVLA